MKNELPVILLAFANDPHNAAGGYLRQLPVEINGLKAIFDRAQDAGLCAVEILTNTTIGQLIEAFQKPKYRGRIAVFHYSGHASSFDLLLEDEKNSPQQAHSEGLLPFLAAQPGLQLVFLNGCFSWQQASELSRLGVPVVIGTVKAVDDAVATQLSQAFYQGLTAGLSIGAAWKEACWALTTRSGERDTSVLYQSSAPVPAGSAADTASVRGANFEETGDDRFPWDIRYKEGAEEVAYWNLPDAVANPLFGLPPLPAHYTPPEPPPYRFLRRFEQTDAAIFFGRGRYIRDLYHRLSSAQSSPVLLVYGQSGVGKSSLLSAGLLPRLESGFTVHYLRRSREQGLSGGLREALGVAASGQLTEAQQTQNQGAIQENIRQLSAILPQLTGEARQEIAQVIGRYEDRLRSPTPAVAAEQTDLRLQWMSAEQAGGRPVLIFLDQVEEIYTRPNPQQPRELEDFLAQVQQIFNNPLHRPAGKLVLTYRKEYQPELQKALSAFQIPCEPVFLEKLDRRDILEVINGLTSTQTLRNKYNLQIEPELPVVVADDLLVDRDSPVAPVLQIVLSKMWQMQAGQPNPVFRLEEYETLRQSGILLSDFFAEQMAHIQAWEAEISQKVGSSGLALDVLNYHTTLLGTAESRTLDELRRLYQHQSDVLNDLVHKFQELYLLTDVDGERTGLAHDTLAPIVQQQMKASDKPGQRALRILQAKITDYGFNPEGTIIEEEDLALVEKGVGGMRLWMDKEPELIEKSRRHRAKVEAERRRNRRFRRAAVVALAIAAGVVFIFWQRSEYQRRKVEINNAYNEGRLQVASDPTLGLQKMKTACLQAPLDSAKWRGYYTLLHQNLTYEILLQQNEAPLLQAAFSADGSTFATTAGNEVHLYHTGEKQLFQSLSLANNTVHALYFQGNDTLWSGAQDRKTYAWVRGQPLPAFEPEGGDFKSSAIQSLCISSDGQWLCTAHHDAYLTLWDIATHTVLRQIRTAAPCQALAFSPDGMILAGLQTGETVLYDRNGTLVQTLASRPSPVLAIAIQPMGNLALVAFEDGMLLQWLHSAEGGWQFKDSLHAHALAIETVSFSPDGNFVLTGSRDHSARLFTAEDLRPIYTLLGHTATVHSTGFRADHHSIFTAAADGTVRRWIFPYPLAETVEQRSSSAVIATRYSQDGRYLLTAADSTVAIYQVTNHQLVGHYTGHRAAIMALAVSNGTRLVASGDVQGQIHVWSTDDQQSADPVRPGEAAVRSLALSPDGRWLVAAYEGDSTARLWDRTKAGAPAVVLAGHRDQVSAVAIAPDGSFILTGTLFDSSLLRWSLPAGKALPPIAYSGNANQLYFPFDKSTGYAALSDDNRGWWYQDGQQPALIAASVGLAWPAAGDGYLTYDERQKTLELRTPEGYPRQTFWPDDAYPLTALGMSRDGQWVVAGKQNGKVLRWRVVRRE